MNPDVIGWSASGILLATLLRQIAVQAADPNSKGVSRWLFIGQILASAGFILYSWLVSNMVFIATNSAILATAVVGQWTLARRSKRK